MQKLGVVISNIRQGIKRSYSLIGQLYAWQPYTVRGLLALALSIWLLISFAIPESDLIAYMIGGGLLVVLGVVCIVVLFFRLSLARTIQIEPFFQSDENFATFPIEAGFTIKGYRIPPFFRLSICRVFNPNHVESITHRLKGRAKQFTVIDSFSVAHRGLWTLRNMRCSLEDAFGFSKLSWEVPCGQEFEVSPPLIPIRPLPVMSASSVLGDLINQSKTRTGDPYDLKQYDPSDGIRRILWKTYARSGELVVRRPEPAVIPEGEVAVYLVANKTEDYVAGALCSYLAQIEQQDIVPIFGTEGLEALGTNAMPTLSHPHFVSGYDQIRSAINRCVWDKDAGSAKQFEGYLESLQEHNHFVSHILVFGPEERADWIDTIARAKEAYGIELTLAVMPAVQVKEKPVRLFERLLVISGIKKHPSTLKASIAALSGNIHSVVCERFKE